MSETRDEEQRAAEALARALEGEAPEGGTADEGLADLVQTAERVRASAGFTAPLDAGLRDSILDEALDRAVPPRRRPRVVRLLVGAVAAAVAVFVLGIAYLLLPPPAEPGSGQVAVGVVESAASDAFAAPTDSLFDGPFPEGQSPAARVDRILQARTRGYFAAVMMKRSSSPVRTASMLGSSR